MRYKSTGSILALGIWGSRRFKQVGSFPMAKKLQQFSNDR